MILFRISFLVTILSLWGCTFQLAAQTRPLTEEDRLRGAPGKFTTDNSLSGQQLYNGNCKSCHGDPGKGNFANLDPIPGDPASSAYQSLSDGEIYFYITNGKGKLMPVFSNILAENQRWDIVAYLRSFNPNYVQAEVTLAEEVNISGSLRLMLDVFENEKRVVALLTDSTTGVHKPVKGAIIRLSVTRYFGSLPIGEAQTNELGITVFEFPADLPGNSEGELELVANAGNSFNEITARKFARLGIKTEHRRLLDQRSWFNVNRKAPMWVVFTYLAALALVGGVLLYVLLQLKKLREMSKVNDQGNEPPEL